MTSSGANDCGTTLFVESRGFRRASPFALRTRQPHRGKGGGLAKETRRPLHTEGDLLPRERESCTWAAGGPSDTPERRSAGQQLVSKKECGEAHMYRGMRRTQSSNDLQDSEWAGRDRGRAGAGQQGQEYWVTKEHGSLSSSLSYPSLTSSLSSVSSHGGVDPGGGVDVAAKVCKLSLCRCPCLRLEI